MATALSSVRANQKSALGLSGGLFNGGVSILALVVDPKRLTFNANITYQTGDAGAPTKVFTPINDDGQVRKFSNLDDIIKWVQGAFLDFTSISISIDEAGLIAKKFVPPTDPVVNAVKQKATFTRLKDGIADNKTNAQAKVTAAETSGWDEPTAHPALQANYAALVANLVAVTDLESYYTAQIAFWNAIAIA